MMILAQTSGDELSGFMGQPIVAPLLGMICFFGILLIVVVAALVYVRQRKARAAQAAIPAAPSFYGDSSNQDMPDLDALVNNTRPPQPVSTPSPAPAPSSYATPPARTVKKGTFRVSVNDGSESEAVEVLTVLRDVVDGRLIVQMGDKTLQNVNNDGEFKERFNKVMRELAQVVAKPTTPAEPVESREPLPPPMETPIFDPVTDEPITKAPPAPAAEVPPVETGKPKFSPPPPVSATGAMPGDLPSFRLADNPMEKRRRGQEPKAVPELNIAGAIEAYLQHKLRHTPDYSGRSIHIYPSPDGGVSIEVDGHYYDAVGDIEDNNVREFIANAIQEWQERH